ncbi:MAG: thiol:disulfide interchange protein [Flavobacteriaceae bacterium]|nr:thiol:disulfide interchange protein [Flavobacteriaceae bacterium]
MLFILLSISSLSQNIVPNTKLKNLESEFIYTNDVLNENNFYIVSFWATWCIPCINELDAIVDIYEELEKDNVEVIAISTDDARTKKRVRPMINGKDWNFKIILDENHDLKRALNIVGIPHTIITKGTKIIYRRIGYSPGEEVDLFDFIKEYE